MTDLISRAYVLAEYDRQHQGPPGVARKIMEDAPAIDAAPVVRCRDCVYGLDPDLNGWYVCNITGAGYPSEGYCSHGVRRDDDAAD